MGSRTGSHTNCVTHAPLKSTMLVGRSPRRGYVQDIAVTRSRNALCCPTTIWRKTWLGKWASLAHRICARVTGCPGILFVTGLAHLPHQLVSSPAAGAGPVAGYTLCRLHAVRARVRVRQRERAFPASTALTTCRQRCVSFCELPLTVVELTEAAHCKYRGRL